MNSKKWIKILLILCILGIGFILIINIYIDSYSVLKSDYNKLSREPNQNFIKMKFLLNEKHNKNSFIFGSSRVGKIEPSDIPTGNFYNMTYSEGLPLEHLENIKLLIKNNIEIKNLLIGFDDFSYQIDPLKHLNEPLRRIHFLTNINSMNKYKFYVILII